MKRMINDENSIQNPLKLGFFIQPVHPPSPSYADVLREDREAVVLADRLGYCEAFIGEHLVDAAETITSSLAFIASLADACPSITFGTGVLPLANYHPAMAAAQVAMVDHLVQRPARAGRRRPASRRRGGHRRLGLGPQSQDPGGARAHVPHLERKAALQDRRRVLPHHHGALVRPDHRRRHRVRPLQQPHPPIAITSIRPDARGPHTAGASGWSGISATYVGAYVVRAQIKNYLEGRRSAGLSADASGWRVARSVFVADDEATARRYAHREDGAHGFYFHVMRAKLAKAGALDMMRDFPGQPDSELTTKRCIERLVIAGTPASVADQIRRSATRSASSARCSTRATIGPIQRWPGAPWSSWRRRSGPGIDSGRADGDDTEEQTDGKVFAD